MGLRQKIADARTKKWIKDMRAAEEERLDQVNEASAERFWRAKRVRGYLKAGR